MESLEKFINDKPQTLDASNEDENELSKNQIKQVKIMNKS